jgi:hypothetical protein
MTEKFNSPIKQSNKGDEHTPCWTLRDFAELKEANYNTLRDKVRKSQLKPKFKIKRTNYYSLNDLNDWFNSL